MLHKVTLAASIAGVIALVRFGPGLASQPTSPEAKTQPALETYVDPRVALARTDGVGWDDSPGAISVFPGIVRWWCEDIYDGVYYVVSNTGKPVKIANVSVGGAFERAITIGLIDDSSFWLLYEPGFIHEKYFTLDGGTSAAIVIRVVDADGREAWQSLIVQQEPPPADYYKLFFERVIGTKTYRLSDEKESTCHWRLQGDEYVCKDDAGWTCTAHCKLNIETTYYDCLCVPLGSGIACAYDGTIYCYHNWPDKPQCSDMFDCGPYKTLEDCRAICGGGIE
jgi:hypothetical protein